MPVAEQPGGMTNDHGVLVTIGFVVNHDRTAIVLPMAIDADTSLDKLDMVSDAVQALKSALLDTPLLTTTIATAAYVAFIAGEGMIDGLIPFRFDFGEAEFPGTRGTGAMPSNCAALLTFYANPDDFDPGARMREGKNFIPGIARDDVSGDLISAPLFGLLQVLAEKLQSGVDSINDSGRKWYRVLGAPAGGVPWKVIRTPGTPLTRTSTGAPRQYLCTQRRRFVPRG